MLSKRELAAGQADFLLSQIRNDNELLQLCEAFSQATGINPLEQPDGWEKAKPVGDGAKTFGRIRMSLIRAAAQNPFWNHYRNAKALSALLADDESSPNPSPAPSTTSRIARTDPDLVPMTGPGPVVFGQYAPKASKIQLERYDRSSDPGHLVILIRVAEPPRKEDSDYEDYVSDDPSFAPPVNIAIQAEDDEPDWAAEEQARLNREQAEREAESAESSLVTNDSVKTYWTRLDEVKEREEATNIIYVDGKGYRKAEYERMMAEKGEDVRRKDSHDFGPAKEEENLKQKMEDIRSQNEAELERLKDQDADSLLDAMFAQKMGENSPVPENLSDDPDDEPSLWDRPRSEESLREVPPPSNERPTTRRPERMEMDNLSDDPDDEPGLLDSAPAASAKPAVPKKDYVFGVPEGYSEDDEENRPEPVSASPKKDYVFGVPEGYKEDGDSEPDPESEPEPAAPKKDYVFGVPEGYGKDEEGAEDDEAQSSEPEDDAENSVFGAPKKREPVFGPAGSAREPAKPAREAGRQRIVMSDPIFKDEPKDGPKAPAASPVSGFDEEAVVQEDDFDEDMVAPEDDFDEEQPAAAIKNAVPDDPFDEEIPVPQAEDDPFGDEAPAPQADEAPSVPESDDDPFGDEPSFIPESGDDPFSENDGPAMSGQKPDILAETMRKSPIQVEQPKPETGPAKIGNAPESPVSTPKKGSFIRVVNQTQADEPARKSGPPNPMQARFGKPVVKVVKKSEWES